MMGVRKLWIKNNKPISYSIVIGDDVIPNISSGVYSSHRTYDGVGSDEGFFVLQLGSIFIISDTIGDVVIIGSNYPYIATGDYSLDDSRRAVDGLSIYSDGGGNYLVINNLDKFTIYGSYLMPNDDFHEISQYDREGVLINGFRVHENIDLNIEHEIGVTSFKVNYLLTQDEFDSGVTVNQIKAEADGNVGDYIINITPKKSWGGWYSDSLTGQYQPFGSKTGSKVFGHFEYKDVEDNLYLKGFDITVKNGIWSLVYIPNGLIYTTLSEPSESGSNFTNPSAIPTSISLDFNDYKTKDEQILNFMIADDLA